METFGSTMWALAAGDIAPTSTGAEPEFTSHDRLCVLNTGQLTAEVELTIYHHDREPAGPYQLPVPPGRVRHVRINDLIDPEAVPLGQPYGATVRSNIPVVVQFLRQDTRQAANTITSLAAVDLNQPTATPNHYRHR